MVAEACRVHGIDLLLESGTANGVSTEILSRTMPWLQIETFDLDSYSVHGKTASRLRECCPRVTTHIGDSLNLIPNFLSGHPKRSVGVVIDGPKAKAAYNFAERLLHQPGVRFVAVHDTAPFWNYDLGSIPGTTKNSSWAPEYRSKYSHMDYNYTMSASDVNHDTPNQLKYGNGIDIFVLNSA